MSEHDPMCPARDWDPVAVQCRCEEYARVRADEQERNGFGHVSELESDLELAEDERDAARAEAQRFSDEINRMVRELSAIRMEHDAEVAALRERWLKWATVHACCEAGLVASPDPCPWHPNGRLAALRAKAEGLPERADAHTEECPGRPGYRGICTCEGDILISRAAVLALFEETQPTLPLHRTEAGWPRCATCDGGGCPDCTDPA